MTTPSLVVLSSLFPSDARPTAGIFVRERMFRVGRRLPVTVVSPQAWFPGQSLLRPLRPGYRPEAARRELQQGVEVLRPRALCLPGVGRRWDARAMALAVLPLVRRLRQAGRCDLIDAHFGYPDGCAAAQLGRWLGIPYTITLRGTEPRHLRQPALRRQLLPAMRDAARVFTVSASLRDEGVARGIPAERFLVVGNGVDTGRFHPLDRGDARRRLGLDLDAKVLVTVGGLVERKGFHRVIELLPGLLRRYPGLVYLIVGGASAEGDYGATLRAQATALGVAERVRFLGPMLPDDLKLPLSAADLFVLPSSNEGWANVILEAMACGVPVVASDVGGNAEVVSEPALGRVYPFGDAGALARQMSAVLDESPHRERLLAYAREHSWDTRVELLVASFERIVERRLAPGGERR